MDIECLLILQDLRTSLGEGFTEVVGFVFDELLLVAAIVLALLMYWVLDKRLGLLAITSFCLGNLINQFVKSLACVYRPWIRDPRVVPAASAVESATGYSFPSAHTVGTGSVFGAIAWDKRKRVPLAVLCVVLVLLVAFSRVLLGAHTPQDVLAAIVEAAIVIAISVRLDAWLREHREKDAWFLAGAVILGAVVLAIVLLKPYPMDYVDGQLLVDPEVMQRDCFEGVGLFWGFWLGWFFERRWLNFETAGAPAREKVLRVVIGVLFAAVIMLALDPLLKAALGLNWAKLVSRFLLLVVAMYAAPALAAFAQRKLP